MKEQVDSIKKELEKIYGNRKKYSRKNIHTMIHSEWKKLDSEEQEILYREIKRECNGFLSLQEYIISVVSMLFTLGGLVFSVIKITDDIMAWTFVHIYVLLGILVLIYVIASSVHIHRRDRALYIIDMISTREEMKLK